MSNVVLFRFKSSPFQDVIARCEENFEGNSKSYTMNKPWMIIQTGEGLGMVPFLMMTEDQELHIDEEEIMFMGKPLNTIEQQYLEKSTGIALAGAGDMNGRNS